jgi:hypothetical protein
MRRTNSELQNVGCINPYALAEVVLRRKVDWRTEDAKQVLESAFAMPV